MKTILLGLVVGLFATMGVTVKLPASHPMMVAAAACADDVIEVVRELPEGERPIYARLLFVMAQKESGCRADPKCPPGTPAKDCNDDGKACGVLQTHNPEWEISGATCAKVRADRKLGMRVGLTRMRRQIKACGTIGLGISAYATHGECYKAPLQVAIDRCKLAGVDCATAAP